MRRKGEKKVFDLAGADRLIDEKQAAAFPRLHNACPSELALAWRRPAVRARMRAKTRPNSGSVLRGKDTCQNFAYAGVFGGTFSGSREEVFCELLPGSTSHSGRHSFIYGVKPLN